MIVVCGIYDFFVFTNITSIILIIVIFSLVIYNYHFTFDNFHEGPNYIEVLVGYCPLENVQDSMVVWVFEVFRNFNRSLLAKQIWKIIREPSSLVSKILKAQYFKNGDIMDAQLGFKPSYI